MLFDIDAMAASVAQTEGWLLAIPATVAIPAIASPIEIATIASVATIASSQGVKASAAPIQLAEPVVMRLDSNGGAELNQYAITWRLVFKNGSSNPLLCVPPQARGEIVERYKPLGLLRADVAQGCTQCTHYSGHFNYCGSPDRPDLKPVFSENHPLRELPDDRGACCDSFVDY